MKFAIVNLGCKVNRVESDSFAATLIARGGVAVPEQDAQLIVVNTCTVTGEAEKKARKAVRRALRANASALVAVTGCAAAIDPDAFASMDGRVRVMGKQELADAIERGAFEDGCGREAAPIEDEREGACNGMRASTAKTHEAEGAPAMDASTAGRDAPATSAPGDDVNTSTSSQVAEPSMSSASNSVASTSTDSAPVPAPAPAAPAAAASPSPAPLPLGAGFRTRVGVKVQDGCDNACTYCIVHVARGRSTSRPAAAVEAECAALAAAGVKEIVLTGINLGAYRDPSTGMRLPGLLRRLLACTAAACPPDEALPRLRISSIEPRNVDAELVDLLAASEGRVCRHLHLPLQAGSDRVLRQMARPYSRARFLELAEGLHARVPGISLSTDLIVGFPGETDDDFRDTLDAARRCRFSRLHVFPYSRREGTPAAARDDQIAPEVKAARARELRELGEELRAQDYERRVGTEEYVLVEDSGRATTESYHEVDAPAGSRPGELKAFVLPPLPRGPRRPSS